ncbi:hypothetical protein [Kitasatospora sp. NPDC008115]|uniref:hypothetical protein n=1 Tax=Kitasatospora sp. NPDC008115 TaxID=3364022 RepID=UPI0036E534D2
MRVRPPGSRALGRWGKGLLAMALAWAVVGVSVILPLGAGTVSVASAASPKTVEGPRLWKPKGEGGEYGDRGKVTVSDTTDLSNQVVHVSWEGFTPTVDPAGRPLRSVKLNSNTGQDLYAVRVYQCRGTDPTIFDCYGSSLFGAADPGKGFFQERPAAGTQNPEFPFNGSVRVTGPDGRGEADIEVWTSQESQKLGCDAAHPCSIVVEANYGGDSLGANSGEARADCADHSLDNPAINGFYANASESVYSTSAAANENWFPGEACSWANRAVVPLTFAPTAGECESAAIDLEMAGLAMANRAVQQWRSGLCKGEAPLGISYIPSTGEPQARAAFRSRKGPDLALTALPENEPATRPHVYAPLANGAISVVYVVDDPVSTKQFRHMNLTPLLIAKMLTQSYTLAIGATIESVAGNPDCIFEDKEFLAANPIPAGSGETWPTCGSSPWVPNSAPIVLSGTTDLIQQLTTWIAADPEAARFLQGSPDAWGTRLNTFYQRPAYSGYPVDAIRVQDYSGPGNVKQFEMNPVNGLAQVARNVLLNKPTCQLWQLDPDGRHPACPSVDPGLRGLFAIMDSGQAKAYELPEAALRNPAGQFVTPSLAGLQAAVDVMATDPATGTQRLPYGAGGDFARAAGAYPLTTVQYAMTPTEGLSATKSKVASEFLRRVTDRGEGQRYGTTAGLLARGFLALTDAQLAQAQAAVKHVAAQDGTYPGNQTGPAPTPGPGPGGNPGGGDSGGTGGTGGTGSTGGTGGTGSTGSGIGGTGGTGGGGTDGSGSPVSPVSDGSAGTGGTSGTGGTGSTGSVSGASGSLSGGTSGTGGTGTGGTAGTTAGTGGAAAGAKPAGAAPGATPAPSGAAKGPLAAAPVAAGTPAADRSGSARLLLPIALIAGIALLLGGPAALLLAGTPAGARIAAGASALRARLRSVRRS